MLDYPYQSTNSKSRSLPSASFLLMYTWEAAGTISTQVVGSLSFLWETLNEVLRMSFGLSVAATQGANRQAGDLCLSLVFKQINIFN